MSILLQHYHHDSASPDWLRLMREIESDCEPATARSPQPVEPVLEAA